MLTIFRRHRAKCPYRRKGRAGRKCNCPIHAEGYQGETYVRRSLSVRSWDVAQAMVRDMEARSVLPGEVEPEPVLLEEAVRRFLQDAADRELAEASIKKHRTLLEAQLIPFARRKGFRYISELDLDSIREFRSEWKDAPLSASKKLERLKAFFRFGHESGWMPENPAAKVKPPKVRPKPTLPFSKEEIERITWACDLYLDRPAGQRRRVRAMVLLLRYTGLRIRDAVLLRRDAIQNGKIFLHTQKTGTPVWLPIPEAVIQSLEQVSPPHPDYFFYNGTAKPEYAVSVWERTMARLFQLAGVEKGHCHRFRDTLSCDLLMRGVSVENVAVILGKTPAIVSRHYAPWVQERQQKLEESIRAIWG